MQLLMRRPEIPKFVLISPPVDKYDFNFLAPCPASGLVISAEKDNLVDNNAVSDAVKKLNKQKSIEVKHELIKSADHFFSNNEQNSNFFKNKSDFFNSNMEIDEKNILIKGSRGMKMENIIKGIA